MFATIKKYLVLTLGGLLTAASLVNAQVFISEPKQGVVSIFQNQFVAGQAPAGLPIQLKVNGIPVDSGNVRIDGVFEFLGVPTPEGPVTYTVSVRMPNGQVVSVDRQIHRVGSPDSIIVSIPENEVGADGRTIMNVTARVVDKWGVRVGDSYFVTVRADSLTMDAQDVDPNTPGIQLRLKNGEVTVPVHAPREAGIYTLSFSTSGVSASAVKEFSTPVEPLMLVGSAEGSVSSLSTGGLMSDSSFSLLKSSNEISDGLHSDGRLAFYGRGSIWGNYLLTASYDNQRIQRDRLFKDLDPDILYSIYGDNSNVDYTAQTSSPLFVKLERNRSYLMFGDFNTAFGQNELARYDRSFTGVKAHYETKEDKVNAFATITDRKVVQKEIRGEGISGFYFLSNSNVVEGSEKVRIEVRDKLHSEVVLSRVDKARISDYQIDYEQGTLFFTQPVPSIDDAGNPVYIVVSYEAQTGLANNYVAGAEGEKEVVKGLTIGASAVTEQQDPKNYTLLGVKTGYSLGNSFKALGEVAQGQDAAQHGAAWDVEVGGAPIERLNLKSYFKKVEAGFVNPTIGAGGLSDGLGGTSTERYGVGGDLDAGASTKLVGDYYHTISQSGQATVTADAVSGGIEHTFAEIVNTSLKVENAQYASATSDTLPEDKKQSTLLDGKATVKATSRLDFTGEYVHNISSSSQDAIQPSVGTIGAQYRVIDPVVLSLEEKIYQGSGNSSVVGLSSSLGYGTTVTSKYEIGNGISGKRNEASIGLKNTTKLTDDLTSELSYERTKNLDKNVLETSTPDHNAFSVGFEYLPKASYKATIKGEIANDGQSNKRDVTFGGDLRLARDFTLLEKMTYYEEIRSAAQDPSNSFSGGTLTSDPSNLIGSSIPDGVLKEFRNTVGIAYRPVSWDWLNAIGKFEQRMDYNGMVTPETYDNASIVSLHAFVEPIRRLELGMKYALKVDDQTSYGLSATTLTDFYLLHAEYDLNWHDFDVAGEYRILSQREANDQKIG
ncbi:MAG TPA: hypothetical protein VMG34_14900, partial [Bacteroidota bacterium]|nr:hypothetical protein [Bacteroidota bacterium]